MTGTQVAPVPAIISGTNDTPMLKPTSLPIRSIESVHLKPSATGTDNAIGVLHSSTLTNGAGDSKKLSKDMDKKEITLNGGKLTEPGVTVPPHKLPQQGYTSSGTILKNDCIDLDKNLVAVDLKNLKENSLIVNNLKSLGVGVRVPLNATITNGAIMKGNPTNPSNAHTIETDDEASASDHGSEDETERYINAYLE